MHGRVCGPRALIIDGAVLPVGTCFFDLLHLLVTANAVGGLDVGAENIIQPVIDPSVTVTAPFHDPATVFFEVAVWRSFVETFLQRLKYSCQFIAFGNPETAKARTLASFASCRNFPGDIGTLSRQNRCASFMGRGLQIDHNELPLRASFTPPEALGELSPKRSGWGFVQLRNIFISFPSLSRICRTIGIKNCPLHEIG
jgi:hypothetical protein